MCVCVQAYGMYAGVHRLQEAKEQQLSPSLFIVSGRAWTNDMEYENPRMKGYTYSFLAREHTKPAQSPVLDARGA